jgi:hypothetical protein
MQRTFKERDNKRLTVHSYAVKNSQRYVESSNQSRFEGSKLADNANLRESTISLVSARKGKFWSP